MRVPILRGVIDRRILVNFRVEPEILARLLQDVESGGHQSVPVRPKPTEPPRRAANEVSVGMNIFQARAMVFSRRILACNCRMPYSSASAVGGQPGT